MPISRYLVVIALLTAIPSPRYAQTADSIVAGYVAATGGAAKWAAVQTWAVSSRSEYVSSDLIWKKPNRIRIDLWSDATPETDTRGFDGTTGWRLSSLEGGTRPRTMSAGEIAQFQDERDWMWELIDYRTKGHKVELVGIVPVDGRPANQLKLTRSNGDVVFIFLDVKTSLEVQRVRHLRAPSGEDLDQVLEVGDYRAIGGLMLPHRVGPATRVYQVNAPIDDARFRMPGTSERNFAALKVGDAVARLLAVGASAPDWMLEDARGQAHHLSDYRGKVVVLDFSAVWCAPCHKLMPEMQQLHDQFSARGVVVLNVSTIERGGDPAQLMTDRGYTYGLVLHGETIQDAYHVVGLPTIYVIGVDGRILDAAVGAEDTAGARRTTVIARHLTQHGR